ncbi:subtilisin-like protease SBT4.15 [Quillaja saponaria]|uniref:Subtilisin-like protease SBT4.15 n=1 Tax=Quillaja saponaria TaxID=32244 RepID=A0AAD7Q736_QUISA|nr:subtilisin-like protease SBT4.15 [Quillaja saponaria]
MGFSWNVTNSEEEHQLRKQYHRGCLGYSKVIGAKYFNLDSSDPVTGNLSPVDEDGHGTHTSSTAAGSPVKGASLYGIAKGTARGGVPTARIAMYKVCWDSGCNDMDLLAAFDDAIADGVDVISVSIGGPSMDFFDDPIAIGAFHAMKNGILTSCSGGNDGPSTSTVQNVAPWIMTIAATGIDREFRTVATLGNGKEFSGIAINTFAPKKKMYPLTSGDLAANNSGDSYGNASACDYGTLSSDKVKGRIVYCLGNSGQDDTIKELGGAGTIMALDEKTDTAYTTLVPGTFVLNNVEFDLYINSTKNPLAVIQKTTTTKIPAPFIASFSSRGPQHINPNILKPDIAAPGLNILAAYSKLVTITGEPGDNRYDVFNIISGTSMACPHACRSCCLRQVLSTQNGHLLQSTTRIKIEDVDIELASGSGQINPVRAVHPGLVYDISMDSYISFLCKAGYNGTSIGLLIGDKKNFNCNSIVPAQGIDGLNYPTMHTQLSTANSSISAIFYRTVTNVGYEHSAYKAKVTSPKGLSVEVIPDTLNFSGVHEKQSFKVVLKGDTIQGGTHLSALLEWNDSNHTVRSPILVFRSAE